MKENLLKIWHVLLRKLFLRVWLNWPSKPLDKKGVDIIGGSGGVFYNEAISMTIKNVVEDAGYRFLQHKNSCAGDGSVSLGQAAVAALRCRNKS